MKFYGQDLQDKWIYEKYFLNKKDGVFLEAGAKDGVSMSNTLFFEETLGWRGVCVEPSPHQFKKLQKNRKCICDRTALAGRKGLMDFLNIENKKTGFGDGLSGLIEFTREKHKKKIATLNKETKSIISVKADTLNNVLNKYKITHLDFLSLDTEGSEFDILESLDYNIFNIDVLLIERDTKNEQRLHDLLVSKKYKHIQRLVRDNIYEKIHIR